MSVIDKLATSMGRRDEVPNLELAQQIAEKKEKKLARELVENLGNKNKDIQSDCIKVLYEIGGREPSLISEYADTFVSLLGSKNNRLVWGAMTAIDSIALEEPRKIHSELQEIVRAAEKGSVITRDHAVSILIKLASTGAYAEEAFRLLLNQLKTCPTNQLPMYAEQSLPIINDKNRAAFIKTLNMRLREVSPASKQKRIERVLRKLGRD